MYDSFDRVNAFMKFNQGEITMSATYKIKALIKEIKSETSVLNVKISGKSGKYAIEDAEDSCNKKYNLFWQEDTTKPDVSIVTKSADSFLSTNGLNDIQKQIIFACYSSNKLIELTINEKYIIENVKGL